MRKYGVKGLVLQASFLKNEPNYFCYYKIIYVDLLRSHSEDILVEGRELTSSNSTVFMWHSDLENILSLKRSSSKFRTLPFEDPRHWHNHHHLLRT